MPDRDRTGFVDWLFIALPALVAAALCAYHLSDRSLWIDEGASLSIASQHGAALWRGIAHDGGNMLVYYLALHAVISIFGDGLVALRMMSLLADTATAALVGMLALRLFASRGVAVVAGLLSAVSVGLIFWGQDARGYAAMVTAVVGSFYALVALLEADDRRVLPVGPLLGYVLSTALALYIGFDAVLVVPAQVLLALMLRRRLRTLIAALVVVGLLCVPLLVLAMERGSSQLFWVPPLTWPILWQTLITLVSGGLPPNFHTTALTVIATAAGAAVTVAALVVAWRARWRARRAPLVIVPVLWLVAPTVIGILAYAVGEPIELARISILLMPAVALIVAWALVGPREGLAAAPGRIGSPQIALGVGLTGLVVVLGLRIAVIVPSYGETPEPWKQVAAQVLSTSQADDCIIFYPEDGRMPFGYYVAHTAGAEAVAPRALLPAESWSTVTPVVERYVEPSATRLATLTKGCASVWLIASHQGLARGGTKQSREHYRAYLAIEQDLTNLYTEVVTTSSGWAAVIDVTQYSR